MKGVKRHKISVTGYRSTRDIMHNTMTVVSTAVQCVCKLLRE